MLLLKSKRADAWAAAALISFSTLLAYGNSFRGPFVFDDLPSTVGNVGLARWKMPWGWLSPPQGTTVSGRPIANLTLGFNYALSGSGVWSYHAFNLLILILGGLTLFGILRRTFVKPAVSSLFGDDSAALALGISLLWTLHPLQTESVTYVVQRVESLMGLFYLLTLYCFIRSIEAVRSKSWQVCAVLACLLGMGTKEVMVSAPILVFLYDRTFAAGSFREAWRLRRGFYVGLAATWVPLALLVGSAGWSRQGSAGFEGQSTAVSYWVTQIEASVRYLRLSVWPTSQIFDYGPYVAGDLREVAACALLVVPMVVLSLVALWRWPKVGFLTAWFLVILAPTSVIPVATQTIAEHRMYLPLAGLMALGVVTLYIVAGRISLVLVGLLAAALGIGTFNRNEVYQSERGVWGDVVLKWPENPRGHCSLGQALSAIPGEFPQAISEFETALRLHPGYADAHTDLGLVLMNVPGHLDEAIQHLRDAARIRPGFAQSHFNLAVALARDGSVGESLDEYEVALKLSPDRFDAYANEGAILCGEGRTSDGIEKLRTALRIAPHYARAHFFLGEVLVQTGQIPEAIREFNEALEDEPTFAEASNNLGVILCRIGRMGEGMEHIEAAIRMQPDFIPAHFARVAALMQQHRKDEAAAEIGRILDLQPNDPSAERLLGLIKSTP